MGPPGGWLEGRRGSRRGLQAPAERLQRGVDSKAHARERLSILGQANHAVDHRLLDDALQFRLTLPPSRLVGSHESFDEQPVLANPQGVEGDVSFEHFAGAGIDHAAAVRPAAPCALHPLDDVVAHVERVRSGWKQLDPKRRR